jgi:hypothetical protein
VIVLGVPPTLSIALVRRGSVNAVPTLLEDLLSGDPRRVYGATWETIRSRDPEQLDALLPHVARIRKATDVLDLGGMLRSNHANLAHALDKLENYRNGTCWCENYAGMDQYGPEKEQACGQVRILSTSEPGWSMTYECECAVCGRVFDVEQGDHHITWWKWVPRGEKRRRKR